MLQLETPKGLVLSDLERTIIEGLASDKTANGLSQELGIPKIAITNLARRPEVAAFMQEIIDARNQLLKLSLINMMDAIREDKLAKNLEDEESRLADLTRKDVIDISKEMLAALKSTSSVDKDEPEDRFARLYQQINIIQNGNN